MQNNKFEKSLRQSFEHYQPAMDNDEIWAAIEPELKEEKKKRRFFIFWLLGSVGVGLLGWWLFLSPSTLSFSNQTNQTIATDQTSVSTKTTVLVDTEEDCFEENMINIKEGVEEKIYKAPIAAKTEKAAIFSIHNYKSTSTPLFTKPLTNNPETNKSTTALKQISTTKEEISTIPETQDVPTSIKETEKTKSPQTPDIKPESKPEKKSETAQTKKSISEKKKKKKSKKKRIRPRRKKWLWYGQATAAPVFAPRLFGFRNLIGGDNNHIRKDSERMLEAFDVNLNLLAQSKNGLVIFGGLTYQQIQRRFTFEETKEELNIIQGPIAIIEDAEGNQIDQIYGSVEVFTTTTQTIRHTNTYRFLYAPIGIGYAYRKKRHQYRIYGGLDFTLHFRFKGKFFNSDLNVVRLEDESSSYYKRFYKTNPGMGLWLAGEYSYRINDQLNLMLAPKIRLPFQSLTTTETYGVTERFVPISLNMGVSYLFNP